MPFLGGKRALSGVAGDQVAYSPNPPRLRARVGKQGEPFPICQLPAVRPEGGNSGAFSGGFCAEKVPKRYMFGTHLAVNI
jgi:hypothetical protein